MAVIDVRKLFAVRDDTVVAHVSGKRKKKTFLFFTSLEFDTVNITTAFKWFFSIHIYYVLRLRARRSSVSTVNRHGKLSVRHTAVVHKYDTIETRLRRDRFLSMSKNGFETH